MNIETNQIIQETIKELKDSSSSPITENMHKEIISLIESYKILLEFFNGNSHQIKEAKEIKKRNKIYLKRYIDAFEQNKRFYNSIGNSENANLMELNKLIFELYLDDINGFINLQSHIYTYYFSGPDLKRRLKIALQMKESEKAKKFINNLKMYKYILQILKFFALTPLSEKVLITSCSIEIYKMIAGCVNIKKNALKKILETMFYKLDIKTTIQLDKIDNVIVKTIIFDNIPIYAYQGEKQIKSIVDIDDIESILNQRITNSAKKPNKQKELENYLQNTISSIRQNIGI